MDNTPSTLALLRHLSLAFPNANLPVDTLDVYATYLGNDVPAPEMAHVVKRAVLTCRFFPSIAELLEIRNGLQPRHPGPEGAANRAAYLSKDNANWRAEGEARLREAPPELQALVNGLAKRMSVSDEIKRLR